jgi:DNA repair exonuclease SbcCD nuclease subunit
MKLIVSSDWHLDASTSGLPRFDDVRAAVDEVVGAARREHVDAFLFLGDLCDPDTTRSHRCSAAAIAVALKCRAMSVASFWLAGNHDVVEDGFGTTTLSALRESEVATRIFEQPGVVSPFSGVSILALPFTPRSHAYDPAKYVEDVAKSGALTDDKVIIIGHLNIEGITPGSETTDMPRGRDVFLPTAAIAKHFPKATVLNGHYHQRQSFDTRDGVVVNIPGSLERLTFGEERNEPGYLIVEID